MGFLDNLINTAASAGDALIVSFLNTRISSYGKVTSLTVDRPSRKLDISVILHGESAPVKITCSNYSFHSFSDLLHVRIGAFSACRPWLHAALNDFAAGKFIPIDHPQAKMVPLYLGCPVS